MIPTHGLTGELRVTVEVGLAGDGIDYPRTFAFVGVYDNTMTIADGVFFDYGVYV